MGPSFKVITAFFRTYRFVNSARDPQKKMQNAHPCCYANAKYLDQYTHEMPSPIHDYVSRERLAVIILLSFRDFYFCDKINALLFNYFFNVPNWISISYRNCEEIAMSLLVANATGALPIWVKGSCPYLSWCKFVTLSGRCTG